MRLVTRSRLAPALVSAALLGGFALALVRGENVTRSVPSKEQITADLPRPPLNLASFVNPNDQTNSTVAVVTVGDVLRVKVPTETSVSGKTSTDLAISLDEVLSSPDKKSGDTVPLRINGMLGDDHTSLFPNPPPAIAC
jgi:hypothetical protein